VTAILQMMRSGLLVRVAATIAVVGTGAFIAQPRAQSAPARLGGDGSLEVWHVQGSVYVIAQDGGNITVQTGDDGVIVVDTGTAAMSDRILAEISKLSSKQIRQIINTHVHPFSTGGNENLAKGGRSLGNVPGASIFAHENVLSAMSAPVGQQSPMPVAMWPTDTYIGPTKDLFFNGEGIQITHIAAAHTNGDSLVFFRRSDVIAAGDIFSTRGYPVIDKERGGSIDGVLDGLNRITELTIPQDKQEGGTYVIPGQGRISDEGDVVEYRDTVTIIRDRVLDMAKKGMTLAQVQAAKPSRDYDGRYGTDSGTWTTAMFIEAVYRDVSGTLAKAGTKVSAKSPAAPAKKK